MMGHVGLGAFYFTLSSVADLTYQCIAGDVVERFWDTTNTFQFPLGKITITPFLLCHANWSSIHMGTFNILGRFLYPS